MSIGYNQASGFTQTVTCNDGGMGVIGSNIKIGKSSKVIEEYVMDLTQQTFVLSMYIRGLKGNHDSMLNIRLDHFFETVKAFEQDINKK